MCVTSSTIFRCISSFLHLGNAVRDGNNFGLSGFEHIGADMHYRTTTEQPFQDARHYKQHCGAQCNPEWGQKYKRAFLR